MVITQHPQVRRCRAHPLISPPHHVGPDGAEGPDGHADASEGTLLLAIGHTQAFCPPQAVDPLGVHPPAGVFRRPGGPAPAPAGTSSREVAEEGPEGELVVGRNGSGKALGGAGLTDHSAGPSFGHPELLSEGHDGPPAAVRGQKFPRFSSFSMSLSKERSATIFLSRWFSLRSSSQLLGVVGLHAAVLVSPAVPGRLGDLEVSGDLVDRLAFAEELFSLGQGVGRSVRGCGGDASWCGVLHSPHVGDRTRTTGGSAHGDPVIINLAAAGPVVLTERVDHVDFDGKRVDARVMGVFETVGDKTRRMARLLRLGRPPLGPRMYLPGDDQPHLTGSIGGYHPTR